MNHHAFNARQRKAAALRRYIDGNALRLGCSPAGGAADILTMLAGWTAAHWAEAARRAGVNAPSAETQAVVLDAYRARIVRAA